MRPHILNLRKSAEWGKDHKIIAGQCSLFSLQGIAPRRRVLLYLVISAVFNTIFSLLHRLNSLGWEEKLELQLVSQQDLSENWNTFRQNYSRFPFRSLLVFPSVSSWGLRFVTNFSLRSRERSRKKERKTVDYISTVLLQQQQSFFCPAASAETSSQQTDSSMFRNHNAAHCMLFVYLNCGPRLPGSATISTLRQTEPGNNQAISTACCHSLSSSFHNSHIRFPFCRDWYDKTHNGRDRLRKM